MEKLRLKETEAERGIVNWQIVSDTAGIQTHVHHIQTLVGHTYFCSELTEWTTRITLFVDIGIWEDCKPKPGINSVWRVHSHLSGKRDGKSWGSDSGPDFASHGDKGYSSPAAEAVVPTLPVAPGALRSQRDIRGHPGNAAPGKALWAHQKWALRERKPNRRLVKLL